MIHKPNGKLFGIGLGPGDPDLITLKAVKVLHLADVIYVPKSKEQASTALHIVQEHLPSHVEIVSIEFPMAREVNIRLEARKQNAQQIEKELENGKNVVFLTLGDPMLYSTYSYVLEYLSSTFEVETIPGIYSFSAISSLLNRPLTKGNDKLAVVCSFDENTQQMWEACETLVFMKVSAYYDALFQFLTNQQPYNFCMITDAGKPSQKVYENIDVLQEKVPYFSTAILQKQTIHKTKKQHLCQESHL